MNKLATLLGAGLTDFLSGGSSLANLTGQTLATAIQSLTHHRIVTASEILRDELRQGETTLIEASHENDFVACLYRYGRAAEEGAAQLNLRLLAKVIKGLAHRGNLFADKFLYYADMLSSLKREEILVIGTLHRHRKAEEAEKAAGEKEPPSAYNRTKDELIPEPFKTEEELESVCAAASRSGLLIPLSGWGQIVYTSSPLMDEMESLAEFEAAILREPEP